MNNEIDIAKLAGLSDEEAASRLLTEGYNETPTARKKSLFLILFEIVKEPMFLLLIACGVLYLILGDFKEVLTLLGFVFVIIGTTLYQENKMERALDALRDLSSPRALVMRGEAYNAGSRVAMLFVMTLFFCQRVIGFLPTLWFRFCIANLDRDRINGNHGQDLRVPIYRPLTKSHGGCHNRHLPQSDTPRIK